MVFDGIDEHGTAVEVLQHRGHVGVERVTHAVIEEAFAVFGPEDKVDVKAGERLWHGLNRPFRAWDVWGVVNPGRCPGLRLKRAFGAVGSGNEPTT